MPEQTRENIAIVGAGIVGLAVATELAALNKYDITVVAKDLPSDYDESQLSQDGYMYDYTSLWAGAHYRPFPYDSKQGKFEQELTRITYTKFKKLALEHPESTIRFMKGYDFIEKPSLEYRNLVNGYNGEYLENFKEVGPAGTNDNITFGAEYDTWSLNSPFFLKFLYQRLLSKNEIGDISIRFIKAELGSVSDVFKYGSSLGSDFAGVVNCSGYGLNFEPANIANASKNNIDSDSYKLRGQTLLLKSDKLKETSYYNKTISFQTVNPSNESLTDWTFIIPRPPLETGVFILGGTKQVGKDHQITPTAQDRDYLLTRAKKYFPELFDDDNETPKFEVIKNVVGFRPFRKSGFRLDQSYHQVKSNGAAAKKFVINSYGAGSMGYEISFGAAAKVVELIQGKKMAGGGKHKL